MYMDRGYESYFYERLPTLAPTGLTKEAQVWCPYATAKFAANDMCLTL